MLVTRTKLGLEVATKVANLNTNSLEDYTAYIGKVDSKKIDKEVAKVLPEHLKFVATISVKECNKLFGVPEADFMAMAIELDPVTRKPLNGETTEEAEAPAEVETEATAEAPKKNRK